MSTAIGWALGALLALAIIWLAPRVAAWLSIHGKGVFWDRLKEIARQAVRYAQQYFGDKSGDERYEKAAEWFLSMVAQFGWKVNPGLVRGIIESALRTLKDHYGEDWAKAPIVDGGGPSP